MLPAEQAFPVGDQDPVSAAVVEPMSIAVRAVVRGRVQAGEKAVVFGAGPIGIAVAVAATDKGAEVLLVEPIETRLERAQATGADTFAPQLRSRCDRRLLASGPAATARRSCSRRRAPPRSRRPASSSSRRPAGS